MDIASTDISDAPQLARDIATAEGHIPSLVTLCKLALDRGDLEQALRFSDRAVRLSDDNSHLQILRGTALVRAGRPEQAVRHFFKAIDLGGSPDGEIGLGFAYSALGDIQKVAVVARSIVGRFAIGDYPLIPLLLRRASQTLGDEGVGWVSISADGRLAGSVNEANFKQDGYLTAVGSTTGLVLARESYDQVVAQAARPGAARDGFIDFEFTKRVASYSEAIHVLVGGTDLIGSPAHAPLSSQIEGFVEQIGSEITGWVVLMGHPSALLTIRLIDQNGTIKEFPTGRAVYRHRASEVPPADPNRQEFCIELADFGWDAARVEIWGWLPALGIGNQLSGSPLGGLTAGSPAVKPPAPFTAATPLRTGKVRRRSIDIIIPVFDGASETIACLKSVIASRQCFVDDFVACSIVVVDDQSSDKELLAVLTALAADGDIQLLHNPRNLGFPASVNRGFELHNDRDVVVLNSDTIVFADWLPRLRAAAYSAADIGTVTPFSNEASILSYPKNLGDNPEPSIEDAAMLDRLASRVNDGLTLDIPTAVGFCMYIRRDCLDAVGSFDIQSFGRGYGEENDLCMRAQAVGWRNIAAPNIFVTHIGGHSFGASKKMLIVRNTGILNKLHPGYDQLVREFIAADPLSGARRNLDMARLRLSVVGPAILLVTLALVGGVARHVEQAAERYLENGLRPLVMRPLRKGEGPEGHVILSDPFDETLCNLIFDLGNEFDMVVGLLAECGIDKVELHHFLGLDAGIFALPGKLSVPYDVVLHDYSWICPRINLIDARERYCGAPLDIGICERCVAVGGNNLDEEISVSNLRKRSADVLGGAQRVIAGCFDVADRFRLFIPEAAYSVTPWEPKPAAPPATQLPQGGTRLRVALIGAVGEQKGYDLLLACARDAALRDLPIEFVLIGYTGDDFRLFKTGRVFVTGRYNEAEAVELIRTQGCNFAFLPSVSPETWSYTLTQAWTAGLEVLAFDFGAIAERIRDSGYGRVIPFSDDAKVINQALLSFGAAFVSDNDDMQQLAEPVQGKPIEVVRRSDPGGVLVSSIGAFENVEQTSHQTLVALDPGIYAFSVNILDPRPGLEIPTVEISLAAGHVLEAKVDFLGKHDPIDNWLTEKGDVIVARVAGGICSLAVKSLRVSAGNAAEISIECHRLDSGDAIPDRVEARPKSGKQTAQITCHIQNRGDLPFIAPAWAGCVGEHLWIEAFTINPLEGLLPEEIEYKALTGTGFETPWLPGGTMCGTRGTANPLIAFAIRLKGSAAERYECRYRGIFGGSGTVGPVRNGGACRSVYGRDPLEAIGLEIVEKTEIPDIEAIEYADASVPEYEIVYGSY